MKTLNKEECFSLLSSNYIGRIGYVFKGNPEIIPITYYFDEKQEAIISYSGEGQKINAMRKNPDVSFQVDEITDLQTWKSIIFHGKFEELSQSDAKLMLHSFAEGVKRIVQQKEKKNLVYLNEFSSKIETPDAFIVYRIKINDIKGRERNGSIES